MNPWRWVDPLVRDVRLTDLRAYMQARGWKESQAPAAGRLVFQGPRRAGEPELPGCVLPDSEQAADYGLAVTYFLTALSEAEDRHPVVILEEILGVSGQRPGMALVRTAGS